MEVFNLFHQKEKNVLWIDQNNNKEENRGYLKFYSKELKGFAFTLVTSVKEGYSFLRNNYFELIYVILSGRLAEEFLDIYEENLRESTILTLNIIFCFNGKYHQSKKYANDPFYNPGGVVTEFKDVINFLKKENNSIIKFNRIYPLINKNFDYNNYKKFIIITNNIQNIAFPVILKKFASRFINEENLETFKRFLINNYYDVIKNVGLLDIFNSKIKIPFYLFTKIFIRLYTIESDFYKDLNKSLLKGNYSDFNQYIFTLYYGLNQKIIKDYHESDLYSTTIINQNELDDIIHSPNKIVLLRTFQSFTKDFRVAIDTMRYLKRNILFVVNSLKQKDITVTNMDIENISIFKSEREVLFPPFSGFEISEIKEQKEYTIIYLNYLNKYEKKIIDYIDAKSKDKVEIFIRDLVKESQSSIFKDLFSNNIIQLIEDYRTKKNVLWIDQYSRCSVYDDYIKKYSTNLKDYYFERATTITEAFSILSNYEFKMIYIIINDKLSEKFFSEYLKKIQKLGIVTANIIFCDEVPKKKYFHNDPFLNPGGIAINFAKIVNYLNTDECGFKNILAKKKTINSSFTGKNYGNIFKLINEKEINIPYKIINKINSDFSSKDSINNFKNFIYNYGNSLLSATVNPSQEKIIDLPLFIYPKFYMRMYGLETPFYYDINKYLTNQEKNFGIFNIFVKILYYGLSQKILISSDEFPFYRGGVISKKEFKILKKNNYYTCKNFLSFSKNEGEANKFLIKNLKCDDSLYPAKFIIASDEKKENENCLVNNVEMRHYSGIASEQEVLFLPLSSFKVVDLKDSTLDNKEIKIIKFNYVGMFDNK